MSERAFLGDVGKADRYPQEADPTLPRQLTADPSRPPIQQHRYSLPDPYALPRIPVSKSARRTSSRDSRQSQILAQHDTSPPRVHDESDDDVDVVVRSAHLGDDEYTHELEYPNRNAKSALGTSRTIRGEAPRPSGPRSQSRHKIPSAFLHHEKESSVDTGGDYEGHESLETSYPDEDLHESAAPVITLQQSMLDRAYDAHPSQSSTSEVEDMPGCVAESAIDELSESHDYERGTPSPPRHNHRLPIHDDAYNNARSGSAKVSPPSMSSVPILTSTPQPVPALVKKALPGSTSIKARIAELEKAGLGGNA